MSQTGHPDHCLVSVAQCPQPGHQQVAMAVPGGGAAWCRSPARTGPLRDTEAWSQHHRQRRWQLGQPRLRSEKNPSPRAVGQSQGTKRFGTWELQVKLSALPTGRWHGPLWPVTRAPRDGGPGPGLATPIAELREVLLNGIGYRLSNSRSRTRPQLPDVVAGKALLGSGLTLKRQRVKVKQSRKGESRRTGPRPRARR